jgi:hypothetical protein
MKKKTTKKYFTLLEIILTITLLSICFSFIGIKINTVLYSYKFKDNIKKIDAYFEFCKKMAETNQADIYLKLSQNDKKTYLKIGTDEKMGFFEKTKKLDDVFNDFIFAFNKKNIDNVEIIFSSNGEVFPKGKFVFSDKKNKFSEKKTI